MAEVIGICLAVVSRGRKELADLANGVWHPSVRVS
jgi:hypothetical protein